MINPKPSRLKSPGQSLEGYVATLPILEWVELPLESITKAEYAELLGGISADRIASMLPATSTRDMVVESLGLIERTATDVLRAFLVEAAATNLCGLPGKPGKLRDLELKLHLLLALGLISKSEFGRLDALRLIRNAFSHDPDLHHFEHNESVRSHCRSLQPLFDNSPFASDWRKRFNFAASEALEDLLKLKAGAEASRREYAN